MTRLFSMASPEDRIETVGSLVGLVMFGVLLVVAYWVAVQI